MENPINVFGGGGFVGSNFISKTPGCIVNDRDDYIPKTKNVLYFISTIHNYNIFTNPYLDIDTNLTTLIKVLENFRSIYENDSRNCTFNFISSWFVYGDTDYPAIESSHCNPKGFYSITKRAAEQLLISYCQTYNIKYRILRLANVISATDRKTSAQKNALVYMIRQLKAGLPVNLYDGGNIIRDLIDVEDCVDAINIVLKDGKFNTIYNISNGVPVKIGDFILEAKAKLKSNSKIINVDPSEFHDIVQVKNMYMDNAKLTKLGYKPKYTHSDIIDNILTHL